MERVIVEKLSEVFSEDENLFLKYRLEDNRRVLLLGVIEEGLQNIAYADDNQLH